jgi:hypothetical protein
MTGGKNVRMTSGMTPFVGSFGFGYAFAQDDKGKKCQDDKGE